jgi:predicted choloylglycine hydrolase
MRGEGALEWLETLAPRWQQEIRGLAEGAKADVATVAAYEYCEKYRTAGCSSFFLQDGDGWIVARNTDASDYGAPWTYLLDRQVDGLNRWLLFSVRGDVFGATGLSASGLWLHYNYAQVDTYREGAHLWMWLADTLESVDNLGEVEERLNEHPRDRAMNLFALHAPTQEAAIYECETHDWSKRPVHQQWAVGTNHFVNRASRKTRSSDQRYRRLIESLHGAQTVEDAKRAILDPEVAQSGKTFGTVFSVIWSSAKDSLWHATGSLPPAPGDFRKVVLR